MEGKLASGTPVAFTRDSDAGLGLPGGLPHRGLLKLHSMAAHLAWRRPERRELRSQRRRL